MHIKSNYSESTLRELYNILSNDTNTQSLHSDDKKKLIDQMLRVIDEEKQEVFDSNILEEKRFEATYQFRKKLAKTISMTRKTYGWSQEQLAKRSGLDRSTIAKIEGMQRNASVDAMISLLAALNIDIDFTPVERMEFVCGGRPKLE